MTKTLTEQWRDGKLPEGYYYTKGAFDDDIYISHFDYEMEEDKRLPVDEVLAPVPSYDEVKRLQEQLKEAQNLIIYTANGHDHLFAQIKCEDYMHKYNLPKWGVK